MDSSLFSKLEEEAFGQEGHEKNWRSSVGMFGNDPFMNEVIEDALDSREQEQHRTIDAPLRIVSRFDFGKLLAVRQETQEDTQLWVDTLRHSRQKCT